MDSEDVTDLTMDEETTNGNMTHFVVPDELEDEVWAVLRDGGFTVEKSNGPMGDWTVEKE